MKKYIYLVAILTLLFFTGCSNNQLVNPSTSKKEKKSITNVIESYVASRQARNIDKVKALLSSDVDQLTSRGVWRYGSDAATAGMKKSTKKNPGKRSISVKTIRFLKHDVALADTQYTIKGIKGKSDRVLWSSFTLIKNSNGKWIITSIRNQKPSD